MPSFASSLSRAGKNEDPFAAVAGQVGGAGANELQRQGEFFVRPISVCTFSGNCVGEARALSLSRRLALFAFMVMLLWYARNHFAGTCDPSPITSLPVRDEAACMYMI